MLVTDSTVWLDLDANSRTVISFVLTDRHKIMCAMAIAQKCQTFFVRIFWAETGLDQRFEQMSIKIAIIKNNAI